MPAVVLFPKDVNSLLIILGTSSEFPTFDLCVIIDIVNYILSL